MKARICETIEDAKLHAVLIQGYLCIFSTIELCDLCLFLFLLKYVVNCNLDLCHLGCSILTLSLVLSAYHWKSMTVQNCSD